MVAIAERTGTNPYPSFRKDNSTAYLFMITSVIWILIGVSMGFILAVELVFPDFARGIPELVFGRLRQAHVNTVLFTWLSGGMMGLWYYIVPRLTGRKIWSETWGNVAALLWNVDLAAGIALLLLGYTQSREYAELIWWVDVGAMVVFLINLVNLLTTIAHRVERKLYVSLWFIIGTLIWFPLVYFIGNVMWHPPTGALTGINDAIINWFYGHNVLGLWFTTGLIPVIYYIVPKETRTPLYSQFFSLFSFWGTAFFYTGVGAHHLLWAPIPVWLKTIAVAESIGMVIPVVAFLAVILLTMRGNWNKVFSSIPLRFTILGFLAYVLVSFQGTQSALRGVNELIHFTQYIPGHSHLGLLLFSASVAIGGIYYAIPRIFRCQLYSRNLANVQFILYLIGFALFFTAFVLVGLVQGTSWLNEGLSVQSVLPGLRSYMALRIIGGGLIVLSFFIFAYNVIATIRRKRPVENPEGSILPQVSQGDSL